MRKKHIIFIAVLALLALTIVLTACTETMTQKAIATDFSQPEVVSSNGGLAVVYGNYLYFVNGYAGRDAENKFGEVVKGGIARIELGLDGLPKATAKAQLIVPKNVYGEDTRYGGIYISNHYIYYATTSRELNSSGKPKVENSEILRTRVDGTDTTVVAKFSGHATKFFVYGPRLTYIKDSKLFSIDLNAKNFPASEVEAKSIEGEATISDGFVYYVVNTGTSETNHTLRAYPLEGGAAMDLWSSSKYETSAKKDAKYTLEIKDVMENGDGTVTIFYFKKDDGINTPLVGIYSYTFNKSTFEFKEANEVRYTVNDTSVSEAAFTKFTKVGDFYLAKTDSFAYFFYINETTVDAKGDRYAKRLTWVPEKIGGEDNVLETPIFAKFSPNTSFTAFHVETASNGDIYLWYEVSNKISRIKILEKKGSAYNYVEANTYVLFDLSVNTSYVGKEMLSAQNKNVIYFLNDAYSTNAFYYVVPEADEVTGIIPKPDDDNRAKLIGIMIETDIIAAF